MFGTGLRRVAFVADSEQELRHFMLSRLLKRAAGLDRDHFFFATTRDPLNQLIKDHDIKGLIPLGEGALRHMVGEKDIERWRGRVVKHQMGIWMVPTFAPSKLQQQRGDEAHDDVMRNPPRFQGVWARDVLRAVEAAERGFERRAGRYLLDPDPARFADWVQAAVAAYLADPAAFRLAWDIETVYKQGKKDESEEKTTEQDGAILRISFCHEAFTGVSVVWSGPYMACIRELLALDCVQVVFNGVSFDAPKVIADGCPVGGTLWDAMDAYHLYEPDLPKGLEWVTSECTDLLPWKHLNISSPALYSAIDADATFRCMAELERALKARGQWQAFLDHSVELMPILAKAGAKGNRVDVDKQAALRVRLNDEKIRLAGEAQTLVPRHLKPRKQFKTQPDDVLGEFHIGRRRVESISLDRYDIEWEVGEAGFCSACGLPVSNKTEHFKGSLGPLNPKTAKPTKVKNPCKVAGASVVKDRAFVPRFYRVLDFNPNSSDQLKNYIRAHGHPMGKDKKDRTKETADAKHIELLIKHYGDAHPVYDIVLQCHKVTKTIGTYLPTPDAAGYIHTEYVNSPSTWRLGSRKVVNGTQIQNWGTRDSNLWALEARGTIIASPGCKLVQIDSASVEAVMLGWFMGDSDYIERASKGVHAWLACRRLGWEFTPDNVEKVKDEHKMLYNQMKMANHMTNYGGSAYILWQSHPKLFGSKEDAQSVQDIIFNLIPKLKAYHHNVRWRAQKEGYLETPWHIRHPFYDVFTLDPDTGQTKNGKDSKRVVAFEPQSSNGTFQRDNIRLVSKTKFGAYLPAIANVHDSMGLDCPIPLVAEATDVLLEIFTRPIPQMGGLQVGAEVEVGDNWGAYHPVTNPGGMDSVKKVSVFNPGEFRRAA